MKKYHLLLVCFFICLTGMGGIGEDETKLPKAVENYRISITDAEGYSTTLTRVTVADGIYLSGAAGKGKHIIEFREIKKISLTPLDDRHMTAKITFRDGTTLSLVADKRHKLKGRSKYGVYSIPLSDLREIEFLEKLEKAE